MRLLAGDHSKGTYSYLFTGSVYTVNVFFARPAAFLLNSYTALTGSFHSVCYRIHGISNIAP